jgi:hypothetical protein
MESLAWLYAITLVILGVYGLQLGVLLALAAWHRPPVRSNQPPMSVSGDWPTVLVQLPVFNERYVVERLIDAAAALNYPSDRLRIQVLDDSTDDTAALARARVAYHRAQGKAVMYHHRVARSGFKAGALAEGLSLAQSEFVAVFDADFIPPPDFLRRLIPDLIADPELGLVQARWEHLNAEQNLITRAQALAIDSYFTVDQAARSEAGLLMNFNGSAGVWRRACIEAAGGWQADTLAEDLDLSYRAQLAGWRFAYRPHVAAPAEIPPSLLALKHQQFRWAKGSFQVLRKLGRQLIGAPMPLPRKAMGMLHLSGYLPHPLALLTLLLSLPVVLLRGQVPFNGSLLGWLGLVLPLVTAWGQLRLRRNWAQGLLHYPVLVLGAIGLAFSNTRAFWEACIGEPSEFIRTPKFSGHGTHENGYSLASDGTGWGELICALYALATALLALERAPAFVPVLCLYALSFGATAGFGFWESAGTRRTAEARETAE